MTRIGRNVWGKAAVIVLGLVVVLGVGAFAMWRMLGQRLGEAAIHYIPSDASIVVTFDTAPSTPSQAALFKRIGDAVESEGLLARIDQMLDTGPEATRIVKDLRPYCTKSSAFAVWIDNMSQTKTPPFVWLIAVTDAKAVDDILSRNGTANPDAGTKGYKIKGGDAYGAVVQGYLVISDKPDLIGRIEKTASGGEPSIASLGEYRAARKSLPEDANFMFFMSPAGIRASEKAQGDPKLYAGLEWSAFGMSIREEGLSLDFQYPGEAKAGSMLAVFAGIKPVDPELLKHLPDGAYGLEAVAQPSEYWPIVEKSMRSSPQTKGMFEDGLRTLQKETGLDVEKDILPAFKGDGVFAVYSAREGKSVDLVFECTDTNSADPATLADKVRALVERKSGEKGGSPVKFVSSKDGDATIWTLDAQSRSLLVQSSAPKPAVGANAAMPPEAPGMPPREQGRFSPTPPAPAQPDPMSEALKDKTINYAVIGKTVILTTSKESLDRAVAAHRGQGPNLADDPAFAAMLAKEIPQSQAYVMIDVGKIAKALRPTLEDALSKGDVKADDILGLFRDGKTGIMFSTRYDGKLFKGTGTMPLDYIKLIHLMAKGLDMANPKNSRTSGPQRM